MKLYAVTFEDATGDQQILTIPAENLAHAKAWANRWAGEASDGTGEDWHWIEVREITQPEPEVSLGTD